MGPGSLESTERGPRRWDAAIARRTVSRVLASQKNGALFDHMPAAASTTKLRRLINRKLYNNYPLWCKSPRIYYTWQRVRRDNNIAATWYIYRMYLYCLFFPSIGWIGNLFVRFNTKLAYEFGLAVFSNFGKEETREYKKCQIIKEFLMGGRCDVGKHCQCRCQCEDKFSTLGFHFKGGKKKVDLRTFRHLEFRQWLNR